MACVLNLADRPNLSECAARLLVGVELANGAFFRRPMSLTVVGRSSQRSPRLHDFHTSSLWFVRQS
jgi:hypothetical protein